MNGVARLQQLRARYQNVFVLDLERQPERKRSLLRQWISSFGGDESLFIGKNRHMKRVMIEHTEAHPTSALVELVPYIYGETALLFISESWETIDDILRCEFCLVPHVACLEGSHGLLTGTELLEYWDNRKNLSNIPSDLPSSHERDVVVHASEVVYQSVLFQSATTYEFSSVTGELNVIDMTEVELDELEDCIVRDG